MQPACTQQMRVHAGPGPGHKEPTSRTRRHKQAEVKICLHAPTARHTQEAARRGEGGMYSGVQHSCFKVASLPVWASDGQIQMGAEQESHLRLVAKPGPSRKNVCENTRDRDGFRQTRIMEQCPGICAARFPEI